VAEGKDPVGGAPQAVAADPSSGGRLAGRTAVVTGGTSGIGLAVVRSFRAEGAQVVAMARRDRPEPGSVGAHFVPCDVADEDEVASAFARAEELVGPLDVVVLNAGSADLDEDPPEIADPSVIRRLFEVNAIGVVHGLRHASPRMQDGGSIVITSTAALAWPFPGYLAYSASKAPLEALRTHAAMKLGPRGIRVNSVSPGTILTEMQPADDLEARLAPLTTCLGRVGTTEDVTGAFVFLASDESRYVTATDIRVDGGWLGGLTGAEAERLLSGSA
jgi:NAD(P)-dependent dehydrogenase (short-subunit alcohol dehydrogenase family)